MQQFTGRNKFPTCKENAFYQSHEPDRLLQSTSVCSGVSVWTEALHFNKFSLSLTYQSYDLDQETFDQRTCELDKECDQVYYSTHTQQTTCHTLIDSVINKCEITVKVRLCNYVCVCNAMYSTSRLQDTMFISQTQKWTKAKQNN